MGRPNDTLLTNAALSTDPRVQILAHAFNISPYSHISDFARFGLGRNPSTLYAWLRGDNPIPRVVQEWCERYIQRVSLVMG